MSQSKQAWEGTTSRSAVKDAGLDALADLGIIERLLSNSGYSTSKLYYQAQSSKATSLGQGCFVPAKIQGTLCFVGRLLKCLLIHCCLRTPHGINSKATTWQAVTPWPCDVFTPFEAALLLILWDNFRQCMALGLDHTELIPDSICPAHHSRDAEYTLAARHVCRGMTDGIGSATFPHMHACAVLLGQQVCVGKGQRRNAGFCPKGH